MPEALGESLLAQQSPVEFNKPKVSPDDLTDGFMRLGLREGDSVMMHTSLESFGVVEGGAAMVLHRFLHILGKNGTLLMPTFTSVSRHSVTHGNYTKPGCWCEGKEEKHIPFIPDLQPDKDIGVVAQRLCSWPSSRRSRHPAYSFVAVGRRGDELISDHPLLDPLLPVRKLLQREPLVLTAGVGLESVTAIHLGEESRLAHKFARERALAISTKGRVWVDILSLGCSRGFGKLKAHLHQTDSKETRIGLSEARVYPMRRLVEISKSLIESDRMALACDDQACLSCRAQPND